jgi:hypothetical protein
MTLNPITLVEQVLGMYCSHISTEFQVRDTQLRQAGVCHVNPGGCRPTLLAPNTHPNRRNPVPPWQDLWE